MKPRKELEAEYLKLARRADDRLRNIEKYSRRAGLKGIKKYAYARAIKDIKTFGGKNRFGNKMPKSNRKLQSKINVINKFLDSPSSLLNKVEVINGKKVRTGILPLYQERVDQMNKPLSKGGWGTNFTWETLAKYYEDGLADKLDKAVKGSDIALRIVAEIQEAPIKVLKALQQAEKKLKKIGSDDDEEDDEEEIDFDSIFKNPILNDKLKEMLSTQEGIDIIDTLFKKGVV